MFGIDQAWFCFFCVARLTGALNAFLEFKWFTLSAGKANEHSYSHSGIFIITQWKKKNDVAWDVLGLSNWYILHLIEYGIVSEVSMHGGDDLYTTWHGEWVLGLLKSFSATCPFSLLPILLCSLYRLHWAGVAHTNFIEDSGSFNVCLWVKRNKPVVEVSRSRQILSRFYY